MKKIRIRLDRCLGCKACEIACAKEHSTSDELGETTEEGPRHPPHGIKIQKGIRVRDEEERKVSFGDSKKKLPKRAVYALQCGHCDNPRCVDACITGALSKDKDGVVIHDPDRCVGCWMCIMACPFGAIRRDQVANIITKCDLCPGREVPACVEACKTDAIELVDVDDASDPAVEETMEETG